MKQTQKGFVKFQTIKRTWYLFNAKLEKTFKQIRLIASLTAVAVFAAHVGYTVQQLMPEIPHFTEVVHAEPLPVLSTRDTILKMVEDAGLSTYEAAVIINGESAWNDCSGKKIAAFNINTNGTIDVGYWRINSIHMRPTAKHYISLQDACDPIKSTQWAIEKRKSDGNWSAWVAAKKAGIK